MAGFALPDWSLAAITERFLSQEGLILLFGFLVLMLMAMLIRTRRRHRNLAIETDTLKQREIHLRAIGQAIEEITVFQLVHELSSGAFRFTFLSGGPAPMAGMQSERIEEEAHLALDLVYEEDIMLLQEAYAAARARLEPSNLELRILDAGGGYRWIHIRAYPQQIGQQLIWDGFIQDITDKKHAERSVAEESRNFQNLFETIDDFLLVFDPDGALLHTNPALQKRSGYSRVELAGMSIFDLYPPDSQTEIYHIVTELKTASSARYVLPLQMKSGALIMVETNLFQGMWKQRNAVFGVARDVARHQQTESALRESQRMLQLIIDTIPMSIFWKDKDSVYLGCNNAFICECRADQSGDVVGRTPFDLFDHGTAQRILERDQSVIRTNQAVMNHSESHTRADGSVGWREISLIPLKSESGSAVGVLGVWRDVTEQNRAEERLKRTLDDMERFNQLMRGRERRTLELKDEINELLLELGRAKKYRTTAEDMP